VSVDQRKKLHKLRSPKQPAILSVMQVAEGNGIGDARAAAGERSTLAGLFY
jgi:hypothetical protein